MERKFKLTQNGSEIQRDLDVVEKLIDEYNSINEYNKQDLCINESKIYICLEDNVTGEFDPLKWMQVNLEQLLYNKVNHQELEEKQDILVSGENVKTINNQSILGGGNLEIEGGSGGSTEVEIKRVWLSYDDKKSIRSDFLGMYEQIDGGQRAFVNDSTRIWYNFETTPINSKMEEEIKNGHFVIRLDYPLKNRSAITKSAANEQPIILATPTKKQGVGTRGYLYSFNEENYNSGLKFRDILLRSLIFVNESDIKVNDYGEKYIHKKISLFDYINRTCEFNNEGILSPITNEWINNDPQGMSMFENELDSHYALGIPHTFSTGTSLETNQHLFAGTKKMKMYVGLATFPTANQFGRTNSSKLNPAFSCYTLLKMKANTTPDFGLSSPYYVRSGCKSFLFQNTGNGYFLIKEGEEPQGKKITRKAYMSARPRCAILNDDYENSRKAFVRTYPQSEQQIRLYCKVIHNVDDFGVQYMPIFRTIITQK